MYPTKKIKNVLRTLWNLRVPLAGLMLSGFFTYLLYASLRSSIKSREQLAVNDIISRMALEFELRLTERHTPVFLEYVNCNVTLSQYRTITEPTLDTAIGSSSSIGWCPRVRPEERDEFTEKANNIYNGTIIDFQITVANGEGELLPRYIDDEDIFPLLYSNPTTVTYTGLDFRVPSEPINIAISTRRPVSTDKVYLFEFGGLSEYVDENYEPIDNEENPISFIVFHAVFDENDDVCGVVASTFEPRGFISNIVHSFTDSIKDMQVLVFRRRDIYGLDYQLFFDMKNSEEADRSSEITVENSLEIGTNSYSAKYVNEDLSLDLIVIMSSETFPKHINYLIIMVIGTLFTMCVWYVNHNLLRTSLTNIKLSKAKSKFLAEMSHELRTPLNGIIGMSDLLESEKLTDSGIECVEDLKTCGTLLLSTISEVLDFSKVEAGKIQMNTRRVDIRDFAKNIMSIMKFYRTYHERKEILELNMYIDKEVPNFMISDFDKIGKIIMNFVGNSLKFTEHGYVSLYIYWECEEPEYVRKNKNIPNGPKFITAHEGESIGYLRLVVKDTGHGMTPRSMENIFRPFQQVQLGRASEGGTGLGLVISKMFAENLRGCIKCESEMNVGTTFTTWVQAKVSPREAKYIHGNMEEQWSIGTTHREQIVPIVSNSKVILIVDDVYINLRMMAKLLNTMGVTFHTASSGEEAVKMCKTFKYELILLDYFMGGMTGIESANEIKRKGMNMHTNIIILTANEYDEEIQQSGLGYIQKPVNRDTLRGVIKKR